MRPSPRPRNVVDGVEFRREVFASYQDQVLVVRLTTSQPKRLTFDVAIDSPQEKYACRRRR